MCKRLRLYNERLTDPQIAEIEGVTTDAVKKWRRRNNLPSLVGRGGANNPFGRSGSYGSRRTDAVGSR